MAKRKRQSQNLVQQLKRHPDYKRLCEEHPIKGKLIEAAVRKQQQAIEALTSNSDDRVHRFHQLASEYLELLSWVHAPVPVAIEEVHKAAQDLVRAGSPWAVGEEYTKQFESPPSGRPVTGRRALAVEALEMKLNDKKLSLQQIATKLDYCGEDEDIQSGDFRCKERLRKQVKKLEGFLDKHQIPY